MGEGEVAEGKPTQRVIYTGKLQITIIKAEELEKMDLLQKADPYVNVKYGSQLSKSNKKKNTLTPEWNHKVELSLEGENLEEIEIEVMDWERLGKDEPMGKVTLPLEVAVEKSSEGGFWLNLEDCKSGKVLVSSEFSGTRTLRTVTTKITTKTTKTETVEGRTSVSSGNQSKLHGDKNVQQDPVPTLGEGEEGDNIPDGNGKQSSTKETTVSWKDTDDMAQGLKSSLLKDDTKQPIVSEKSEEDTITAAGNAPKEDEKTENVSRSAVIEVARSTVTKVIKDAQQKVAEDKSIKASKEDDTKIDPEGKKKIAKENEQKTTKSLDWKDDEGGAKELKSKLLGEEKRDDTVKVLTVAEATVTKVIEDAKQKIAENSSNKTLPITEDEDAEQDDKTVKDTAKEVDIKSDILEGQNAEQASSKESSTSWRDEKGGAKGLRAKLLEGKAEGEGAAVDNEALRSASEATVTKVIADAKQKVSEDESSGTVGTVGKKEIEIN